MSLEVPGGAEGDPDSKEGGLRDVGLRAAQFCQAAGNLMGEDSQLLLLLLRMVFQVPLLLGASRSSQGFGQCQVLSGLLHPPAGF